MAMQTYTRLYDDYDDAKHIVQALEADGIPHSDVSIVANNADNRYSSSGDTTTTTGETGSAGTGAGTGATVGTILGGGAGLLAGIGALAIPGVGPIVAAGWLIATLTGAGIGAAAGGLGGALVGAGVSEEDASTYSEGVRRGGTLVTVRADDSAANRVETILNGRTPVDISARRAEYQSEGWTTHDPNAAPYTSEQIQAERHKRVVSVSS